MSNFNRGKLRHRVALETFQEAQDPDTGILIPAWSPVAEVWAAIEPLSGREFIASQAQQSAIAARITIAYRPDVSTQTRVRHADALYDVQAVLADKDSGQEYLTLMCGLAAGGDGQ